MIRLNSVSKVYGSGKNAVVALDNVSIDFGAKGLVVILGKSGCGKSTLLNIMGGLDKPTYGELVVDGRSAKSFSESNYDSYRNTYVGMVFQEFNLIDEITVYQNIEITMKLQEKNTDVNTVDEVLKMVGLSNLGYRKPSELSGGQRQRVSLARALLKNPHILLADEPTGALDASTSEEVFEVLKKLSERKLVVVVTHDRELAFSYGERIIELVDGHVISDKEKESDSNSAVKRLSENVLEIAAGGEISPLDVNSLLKKGSYNYVGISHDKDRIALAYPETFDSFYLPREKMRMRDTDVERVRSSDTSSFKLQKSALKLKDTFHMARANRKRARKRFWFIAVFNMLCFAMFALSFMLSSVNLPNVIAKSAFDKSSQSVVGACIISNDWYSASEFEKTDIDRVNNAIGGRKALPAYTVALYPYYCIEEKMDDYFNILSAISSAVNPMDISLDSYSGVIEGQNLSDLDLKVIKDGGADTCASYDEIIISDFAAVKLMQRGFFGMDRTGRRGAYFPKAMSDIPGMSVMLVGLDRFIKIAGVFETDYLSYNYLHRADERLVVDAQIDIRNWQNNKEFLYSKIFAKEGFLEANYDDYGNTYKAAVRSYDGNRYAQITFNLNEISYNNSTFSNPHDKTKNAFLWVDPNNAVNYNVPGGGAQLFPNMNNSYNADFNIIVSIQMIKQIYPEVGDFSDLVGQVPGDINMEFLRFSIDFSYSTRYFNIVGIYDQDNFDNASLFAVNSSLVSQIRRDVSGQKAIQLNSLYFTRGDNRTEIERLAKTLLSQDYLMFSSAGSISELLQVGDMFGTAATVFLFIALAIAFFSFLLMLNYMSSSVRFRAKEIAVYRVIGASKSDVAKIFLTESSMLIIVSTIMACALALVFTYFLTLSFKSMLQIFNLSFSILSFNIITVLVVLGAITVLVLLASLIPIMAVTRKKAIDALKVIG